MRLRRLDLTRYGKFTDHVLEFGARGTGPDLHVIYGPNEAGKSTALNAFLDVLFGIERRSAYDFLHPYDTMQVGAALERDGALSEWTRVKANRNSLRDGHGDPVGEHALAAMLGGIPDRDAYRTMFSLDDETLERGGNDILESKGDLGQLLFAASAGLSDLAGRLDALTAEADAFARKGSRKTELAELKRALDALEKTRREIDVQASDYARRVRDRDTAQAGYAAAFDALSTARARAEEVARLQQGLEHGAALARLHQEIAAFDDLPDPPPGWADEIGPLGKEETRLTTERDALDRRRAALETELSALLVDDAVLALGDRIDRLSAESENRYRAALPDLPKVRDERRDRRKQVADLLTRLEQAPDADPRALILPAATVGTLRDLIATRGAVTARLEAALTEHQAATDRLAEAQAAFHDLGPDKAATADPAPSPWDALEAAIRATRADDPARPLQMEQQARRRLDRALSDALAALAPWSGRADDLISLPIPDAARLADWRADLDQEDSALKDAARAVADLTAKRDRLTAEMDTVRTATGVVDDDTAQARRAARDAAWTAHRGALDQTTADAFEAALRADDAATESQLAHTTEVARLREAAIALAASKSDLAHARDQHDAAQARRAALAEQIAATLTTLGLPTDWPLSTLADWLTRRQTALQARTAVQDKDADIAALDATATQVRTRLVSAMAEAGVDAPADATLADLLDRAYGALKHHTEHAGRLDTARANLRATERDHTDRTRTLNTARAAETDWRTAWAEALSGCWLGKTSPLPAPEAVSAMLDDIGRLDGLLEQCATADRRIEGMERDQRAFAADLGAILADLADPGDPGDPGKLSRSADPLDAADALRRRLATAREADSRRRHTQAELERTLEQRTALDAPLAALARRSAEMTTLFGVETLAEVASALRRVAARDALLARRRDVEAALLQSLRAPDLATAETRLSEADPDSLALEAGTLEARISDLDSRRMDLHAALTRAEDALAAVQGDDDAARLDEQRRTLLLEIEDKALRHLRLRLGIGAAQRALALYRDRHRSAMLAHAAQAFATVSRGVYAGLGTHPEGERDVLLAREANGRTKPVSALSKGTRFQLYLALRVAGYHEFAGRAAPVPFVADDIMETFDDFRAEEAFRLFAGMAEVGQVIYLTHHRHLCEIARAVCPTVTIHTLDGPASASAA